MIQKGEQIEKESENIFKEIMAENFPNLGNEIDILVQEAQRVPNKMNPKMLTLRYIVIKMTKVKDKETIFRAVRRKQ